MMLKAGDLVPDAEAMETLPVGAALSVPGSRKLLTRHPDGWAQHTDGRARHDTVDAYREGMEVVSLPRIEYTGPQIGDVVAYESLAAMPEGTVLHPSRKEGGQEPGNNYFIQRMARDQWNVNWYGMLDMTSENTWTQQVFNLYEIRVHSLPDLPGETVAQFAARMRDLCLTGAQRAGEQFTRSAIDILAKMGSEFQPSVGLRIINTTDRDTLPPGTLVYQGNPEQPANFGVFKRDGRAWVPVFGTRRTLDQWQALVIDRLPDADEPADWMVAAGTAADEAEIASLRAQAWKLGFKEKTNRGWCDEFERIMLRSGITKDSIAVYLTPDQVAALPVGTLIYAKNTDGTWGLLKRTETARNRAGTRRVLGNMHGHMSDRMQKWSDADGVLMAVESHEQLLSMPIGTVFGEGTAGINNYVKVRDTENVDAMAFNHCSTERGPVTQQYMEREPSYRTTSFRINTPWHYLYIPGVTD